MKVKPVLGEWVIPRVAAIDSLESRAFVELPIPGRGGSLFQDLNASPTRISISGSLYGDEPRDEFLEEVRGRFRAGEPLTFVADIVTATEVQFVVIETLHFQESAATSDVTHYFVVLRESPPPPPPPDPLGALDAGLLDQAGNFLDAATGALDALDGLGAPDFADPTPPLSGVLDGVQSVLEGLDGVTGPLGELFGEEG